MTGLSQKQQLIVMVLGVVTLIVLLVLGSVVLSRMLSLPRSQPVAQLPTSTPVDTPQPTGSSFATWTPEPTPTPYVPPTAGPRPLDEDTAPVLDQVETDVIALRLLLPQASVSRWSASRRQLRSRYADVLESEEAQGALSSLSIALVALELLPPDTDLTPILRDIYAEQVYSFYDPTTKGIYILHDIDASSPLGRVVYAHAYGHTLQDQNFDLGAFGFQVTESFGYDDRLGAINALVEGDTAFLREQYIENYLSYPEQVQLQQDLLRRGSSELAGAPRAIREMFQLPYASGKDFVEALYDYGGWEAVNAAYANPPSSTEHILHPERYLAGEQPVPALAPSLLNILGDGWHLVYDDVTGELLLRLHLENRLGAEEAAAAADGWGGDRYAIYRNAATGESVTLLYAVWDTATDAGEFADAYVGYADARFGHTADEVRGGVACWEGGDVLCVAQAGDTVVVGTGPDRATVDKVMDVSIP